MDKVYDATKKGVFHNNFKSIGTIIIVAIIGIVSIFGTYQALIANARDMGLELVRSYTADEERNIAVYKTFIQMGMAVRVYSAIGCRGLSRVDFFVTWQENRVVFNEINTIPGFTSISMYPKLFGASGVPYSQLIDKLLELALEASK